MEKFISNVALANSFYEQKKNNFDAYLPFVLFCFRDEEFLDLLKIGETLFHKFKIELPIHTIKDIIQKDKSMFFNFKRKSRSDWEINITNKGKNELSNLIESENQIESRLKTFYNGFKSYCNSSFDVDYTIDTIESQIKSFLINNIVDISIKSNLSRVSSLKEFEKYFVIFLSEIQEHDHIKAQIFDELWKGTVIWNELSKKNNNVNHYNLQNNLDVYVDTNFILSLLGLHHPIANKSAKELHTLLKDNKKIHMKVLDKTLIELEKLLGLYEFFKHDYNEIEVDSVFYYMKKQQYTKIKLERLLRELKKTLSEMEIQYIEIDEWNDKFQNNYSQIYGYIYEARKQRNDELPDNHKKKKSAIENSSHHDSEVLSHILKYKKRTARSLCDVKAIFLTSSSNLVRNYSKIYRRFESYPAAIQDSSLTNYLYLISPERNSLLQLNQVLKKHCKYLMVNSRIWQDYVKTIKELLEYETITMEDYSILMSNNEYINEYLLYKENYVDTADVEDILEKIRIDEGIKDTTLEKTKTDLEVEKIKYNNLESRLRIIEEENKKRQYLSELEIFNLNAEKYAEKKYIEYYSNSKKVVRNYVIFIIIALVVKFINLKEIFPKFEYINIVQNLLSVISFLIPFARSFFKHENVKHSFFILINKKKRNTDKLLKVNDFLNKYNEDNNKPSFD